MFGRFFKTQKEADDMQAQDQNQQSQGQQGQDPVVVKDPPKTWGDEFNDAEAELLASMAASKAAAVAVEDAKAAVTAAETKLATSKQAAEDAEAQRRVSAAPVVAVIDKMVAMLTKLKTDITQ